MQEEVQSRQQHIVPVRKSLMNGMVSRMTTLKKSGLNLRKSYCLHMLRQVIKTARHYGVL